ncbi:dihydrofolate reductase family protein [Raineyella sp. LH-20]|uniref:dihydrofolate reductase family protein n=1 Tax=Raineyella sp. LH-20 TaxID=3081204 RepID=UPI002952C2C1|nr:dihydrofolate reductase family protein [Raineyella sp. LH-20]WOP19997.1 dihydrofolate reductase family protein [Raineyella sp. LH-20]
MRTVFYTASTLNGFLAGPDDDLQWLFDVEGEEGPDPLEFIATARAGVCGSTTYEWVLHHEEMLEHPERWAPTMGTNPLFVFTHRDLPVPAGVDVRFLSGPVADHLSTLAEVVGDGILWVVGGGDLAGQFLDAGALDELQVSIAPATLAGGKPLLPRDVGPQRLHLVSAQRYGQFAHLTYAVRPGRV